VYRISFSFVATLMLCGLVLAQDAPRGEIFGGYSYLNVDYQSGVASSSPIPRQSANGWEISPSFNVNHWFAVEGDVAGYYKNNVPLIFLLPNADLHDYSFTAGPRFNYRAGSTNAFVHALVGGDNLHGSISGVGSASQDSITFAIGGGVVWRFRPESHWAVRGSGDYVLTRHNIANALGFSTPALTQNNFRASVGIVYVFGRVVQESSPRAERSPRADKRNINTPPCAGSSEAALLGIIGCDSGNGVTVKSVQSGSPAATAGIQAGDVITSIDGRAVRSAHDIEIAIGASTSGTVRLGYMIQGNFLTERAVKVR
jgi:hypothetical protein